MFINSKGKHKTTPVYFEHFNSYFTDRPNETGEKDCVIVSVFAVEALSSQPAGNNNKTISLLSGH